MSATGPSDSPWSVCAKFSVFSPVSPDPRPGAVTIFNVSIVFSLVWSTFHSVVSTVFLCLTCGSTQYNVCNTFSLFGIGHYRFSILVGRSSIHRDRRGVNAIYNVCGIVCRVNLQVRVLTFSIWGTGIDFMSHFCYATILSTLYLMAICNDRFWGVTFKGRQNIIVGAFQRGHTGRRFLCRVGVII